MATNLNWTASFHDLSVGACDEAKPTYALWKKRLEQEWEDCQRSVNDSSRDDILNIGTSGFQTATPEDCRWMSSSLPYPHTLHLSDVVDTLGEPGLTWQQIATELEPVLPRLKRLVLRDWIEGQCHNATATRYHSAPTDQKGHGELYVVVGERNGIDNVAAKVLRACTSLETLCICGPYGQDRTLWTADQVHHAYCNLLDSIVENAPPTFRTLQLDMSLEYLQSLLAGLASSPRPNLESLQSVELGIGRWIEAFSQRNTDSEHAVHLAPNGQPSYFEAGGCLRSSRHESLAKHFQESRCISHLGLLQRLHLAARSTRLRVGSLDDVNAVRLDPLKLIGSHTPHREYELPGRDILVWMRDALRWKPRFGWGSLVEEFVLDTDAPQYQRFGKSVDRVKRLFEALYAVSIPIHLFLTPDEALFEPVLPQPPLDSLSPYADPGEARTPPVRQPAPGPSAARSPTSSAGPRGYLQFLKALQKILPFVNELSITYPHGAGRRQSEEDAIDTEVAFWQSFWAHSTRFLPNLGKLTFHMPKAFDQYESIELGAMLRAERAGWRLVEMRNEDEQLVLRVWRKGIGKKQKALTLEAPALAEGGTRDGPKSTALPNERPEMSALFKDREGGDNDVPHEEQHVQIEPRPKVIESAGLEAETKIAVGQWDGSMNAFPYSSSETGLRGGEVEGRVQETKRNILTPEPLVPPKPEITGDGIAKEAPPKRRPRRRPSRKNMPARRAKGKRRVDDVEGKGREEGTQKPPGKRQRLTKWEKELKNLEVT